MYRLPTEPGSIGHTLDAGFKLYFVSFKQVLVLSFLAALSLAVPMLAVVLAIPMFAGETQAPGNAFIAVLVVGILVVVSLYLCFYIAAMCRIGGIAYGQDLTLGACLSTGVRHEGTDGRRRR